MAKYVSAKEISAALQKARVTEERAIVQKLAKLGYDAIMYAYNKGLKSTPRSSTSKKPDLAWSHVTRNLHDSFGSAVYVNGHLIETSIRYIGGELSKKDDPLTKESGRDTLNDFFRRSHYGKAKGEIVLVCVAAMYYAKYLEEGRHRGGYKIQVISAARDYVDQNFNKYLDTKQRTIVFKGIRPISNEQSGLL